VLQDAERQFRKALLNRGRVHQSPMSKGRNTLYPFTEAFRNFQVTLAGGLEKAAIATDVR
jgi:hypothetical protein